MPDDINGNIGGEPTGDEGLTASSGLLAQRGRRGRYRLGGGRLAIRPQRFLQPRPFQRHATPPSPLYREPPHFFTKRDRSLQSNESVCKAPSDSIPKLTPSTVSLSTCNQHVVPQDAYQAPPAGDEPQSPEECQFDPEFYASIPEPPDGGWGWVIVAASFLCNLIVDGITYTFGVFFPEFVDYFQAPKGTVAWAGSLLGGVYLSVGPLVSALTNKFGCRVVCILGSIVSCLAFSLSTIMKDVGGLMVTYGIMGGIGFGLIYLPAIVSVNQYFSKRRAMATGIAVCGSGLGAFVFAPLCRVLINALGWKGALLILAGLTLNCCVFGALMRPLEDNTPSAQKPLLQRIWEEKVRQRQDSLCHSEFCVVQHADGTVEKRPKSFLNMEPGVHSTLDLDQWCRSPMDTPIQTLSPIEEMQPEAKDDVESKQKLEAIPEVNVVPTTPSPPEEIPLTENLLNKPAPNGHVPNGGNNQHSTAIQEIAKRKGIIASKSATKLSLSNAAMDNAQEMRRNSSSSRISASGYVYSQQQLATKHNRCSASGSEVWKRGSQETVAGGPRPVPVKPKAKDMLRPLYRKDIFYSGSIVNLPEYKQSQGDVRSYVASVMTLPAASGVDMRHSTKKIPNWLCLPRSMADTLLEIFDFSLLKNPAFMLISASNVVGMLGFYVPFVYITDSGIQKGFDPDSSAYLLSIIGICNMLGRLVFGWISDLPQANSLMINNITLVVSGISVFMMPFCTSYASAVAACVVFGSIVSAYILLTSIILVELFGLDHLTNSFGLLCLFRGASCIIGPPFAGSIYDLTNSYNWPFFISGIMLAVSGIMTCFIPCIKNTSKPPPQPVEEDFASPLEEIPEESEDIIEEEEDQTEVNIPAAGEDDDEDSPMMIVIKGNNNETEAKLEDKADNPLVQPTSTLGEAMA